jgi:HEAT repeat protein/predicted protein tyrosine phosphatase
MDATDKTESQAYPQIPSSDSLIQPFLIALSDKNSHVRARAVHALGKIGTEAAVTALLDALNHEDFNVGGWAAWALGQIGSEAVITGLIDALNHQSPQVYIWATWALGQIDFPEAVAGLIGALKHKDPQVRWRAASALGFFSGESVVDGLLEALRDRDCFVRKRSAAALGKIGSEVAIPGLLAALDDEEFDVCKAATEALKQIGTEAVVTGLRSELKAQDSKVRERTVWILGQISSELAITVLFEALNDKDFHVRERADEALWKIGLKADNTEILQALKDKRFIVPKSMALALEKNNTKVAGSGLRQDAIELDSTPQKEQAILGSNELPKIFITSCAQASEHLLCTTRGPLIKHLISIGSLGDKPPEGYTQVPHRLRLEFDDIAAPDDDPEYVLPTSEDICKVIDFVPLISQDGGNVLIHCQAGISRSSAVALTVCAVLLGAGKEEEALAYVLEARTLAVPNEWIVELADEALGREGKLVEVVQRFHDSLWEDDNSDDWESI